MNVQYLKMARWRCVKQCDSCFEKAQYMINILQTHTMKLQSQVEMLQKKPSPPPVSSSASLEGKKEDNASTPQPPQMPRQTLHAEAQIQGQGINMRQHILRLCLFKQN